MGRYLLPGLIVLFILELSLLLGEMRVFTFIPFMKPYPEDSRTQSIGKIEKVNQYVRDKAQNSLVWKGSLPSDQLSAFDSILTLNNSSAEISLDKGVKIHLSKNSLLQLSSIKENK